MDALSVGVPVLSGPAAGWNFWPVVGIPLAWLLVFGWLRVPLRPGIAIGVTVVGLLSADAVSTWGVAPVVIGVSLLLAAITIALRHARRTRPPNV
jgi:hypothetical protein